MQNKIKTKSILAGFSIAIASFLVSNVFNTVSVSAYSASLTTSNDISLDAVMSEDGTSIHSESINVQTDCRAGYNLTIATPEGSDLYKYDNGTQSSNTASFTAVDGTSALNSNNNTNKWGYTLTTNPSGSTIFSPLSTTESILKTASQTASPTSDINDTFNINYGVKVDRSMGIGSYKMANNGTVVYYLTMDPSCSVYSVQYQDNGADNPNGMGTTDSTTGDKSVKQTNIAENTKITLLAPNFKKAGYAFLGWSTDQDAYTRFTDNDNTNDPVIYGPMEDVTIDSTIMATATPRNQINMYAVWIPALKDGNNETIYMQEWDNPNTTLPHDGCSTLTATTFDNNVTIEKDKITVNKNSVVALTDKRDNEVYTVARLADGNCWMVENLRLEHTGTKGNNINDPTVTNQSLSQGYGGTTGTYGNFVGLAVSESANFSNSTTSLSFADGGVYKSSAASPTDTYTPATGILEDIGSADYPGYRFPRYNNLNSSSALTSPTFIESYANASSPTTSGTYKTSNISSYGNYYTWAAAMANTNFYGNSSNSDPAGTSICPAGWHLPNSNGATKEYGVLSQGYGGTGSNESGLISFLSLLSNRFRTFPNNFLYSGEIINSSVSRRGSRAHYWSRSVYGFDNFSWAFRLGSTEIAPSDPKINKGNGLSIRCLVNPSDIEIILDSNNGTGAISRAYGAAGSNVALPSSLNLSPSVAQPDYAFSNWNTVPDGSGTSYTSSYAIPAGSTGETLYAQWSAQYTITYVDNCMSWASSDANCTATASANTSEQKINLNTSGNGSGTLGAYNKFTLTGWKIKEWTTNADGTGTAYPVSSTYNVTGANAGDSITLYAHWVPTYTVQYDGNGSDNDSTGMGSTDSSTGLKSVRHTNVTEGDSFDLFASNFKKSGYGFVGWSTDANAWSKLTDNDTTNDAKIWGPNEIITAPAYNGTPITTLYAIWAPAETSGGNPVYLQNWTGCPTMTATTYNSSTGTLTVAKNSITALTDQRDGEVYTIAKLADDNCWMVENLRLADTHEENGNIVATTLTTTNTNILSSSNTLPITNIYNADPALATTSNSLSPTSSQNSTNDTNYGWCANSSAACNDQSRLNTTNTIANITPSQTQNITSANAHTNFNNTIYAYGNYYNWYSATAGYGTYSRSTSTPTDGDLCPAGWHLPYGSNGTGTKGGNTSGGFYYLANSMTATSSNTANSNKFRAFPNNFIYAGSWSVGSPGDRGVGGYYWSASASSSSSAYYLYLISAGTHTNNYTSSKYVGRSVRCVASPAS